MKKSLLFGLLIIVLVALPLLAACTEEAPAPTTAAPAKVIELKYASHMPSESGMAKMCSAYFRDIEKATGGKVKILEYWGSSLLKQEEMFRGIPEGIADMGWYTLGEGGLMPLNEYLRMPLLFKSWHQSEVICRQMYQEFPELRAELEDHGMFMYGLWTLPSENLHLSKKAVRVPADVKGMKIEAASYGAEFWLSAGAVPVEVGPGDWYTSLEKNLIEGMSLHWAAMFVFGMVPITPYHVDWGKGGISTAPYGTVISTKVWNGLPDDVKKVFLDMEKSYFIDQQYITDGQEVTSGINMAKELNQTFIELTPEEVAQWKVVGQPVIDNWLKRVGATGKPAKAVYDRAVQLASEVPE